MDFSTLCLINSKQEVPICRLSEQLRELRYRSDKIIVK